MCGIFGYANYNTPKTKKEITDILINGLRRIEYRGYDSAGICIQKKNKQFELHRSVGKVQKLAEKIETANLSATVDTHTGIAHTRWATHGKPSENNTHPVRSDKENTFVCVHNGIITNYKELRSFLEIKNFKFESETDTECAAKLAHLFYNDASKRGEKISFVEIVKRVAKNCDGAFAFVFMSTLFPNEIVAVRKSSPLLIGIRTNSNVTLDFFDVSFGKTEECAIGNLSPMSEEVETKKTKGKKKSSRKNRNSIMDDDKNKPFQHRSTNNSLHANEDEMTNLSIIEDGSFHLRNTDNSNQMEVFLASDASAIIEHTKKVIYLEDDDIAHIAGGNLNIHRPNTVEEDKVKRTTREIKTVETEMAQIMKGNYEHFMLKEIYEQPESVVNTMRGRVNFETGEILLGGLLSYVRTIKKSQRIIFIACGTSYHSCLANRALFEELVDIPVQVEISSEFIDRRGLITRGDCCIFVSQSGETADTIIAMRHCQERGALCVGITNTVGSTISRDTSCGVHINAGPEIGVASTKAYTSQYVSLVMIALMLSQDNSSLKKRREEILNGLKEIGSLIKKTLKGSDSITSLALDKLKDEKYLLILGRGYQHATVLEAALKIKELTYIPTEGILSGELKHGPIALIDENIRVIFVISNDGERLKANSAVQQIVARKGKPLIFCAAELAKDYAEFDCVLFPSTVDCLQGLISVIPMQLLAYAVAVAKGYDVDCPRNLAKSVTVE